MSEPRTVSAGELAVEELLDRLEAGERVVVRTEFLGSEHEVTLRYDGSTFYCDTPTRLHRHESREAMRTCLENQGYASQ
ncbi:hypothetical protein [Halomicrobium sp. LC1Hm]|uniref:hypothetical protein n=1 Tax=Halomicrobium sp. LC1Hm TaxID=2610902 RepID=UPI0012984E39|nr:hypothetical protein [Halomicrobium sp. LC1Hm]QGA84314.1 Uncharacterized protein LC1Hm_3297 [Halomicrobium sp. LC1Hm]